VMLNEKKNSKKRGDLSLKSRGGNFKFHSTLWNAQ
jgi:hypothetical protein